MRKILILASFLMLAGITMVFAGYWEDFWKYNSLQNGEKMLQLKDTLESMSDTLNATEMAVLANCYTEYANWGLAKDDPKREEFYTKAMEYARQAVDKDPNNAFAHYVLGSTIGRLAQYKGIIQSLFMLGDFDKHIKKAMELDPTNYLAYIAMGMRYRDTPWPFKNYSKSEYYLKKAIEIEPGYPNAYYELAILYEKMGRMDEAKKLYEKIVSMPPHPDWIAKSKETQAIAREWLEKHK